jgi:hypothetical protein
VFSVCPFTANLTGRSQARLKILRNRHLAAAYGENSI